MAGFPPKKNTAFTFYTALVSQADTDIFKTSPTFADGDITVSIDGATFDNIATLPTQLASTGVLPVALTAAEMNGDVIIVKFVDATGAEWQDQLVTIITDAYQISDIETLTDGIEADTTEILTRLPDATAGAAGGLFIAGANAATSITTALTANITGNLSGSVGSVTGAVGSVTGAVGSVTGNVGGNVTGSVASVLTDTAILPDSVAADGTRPTPNQALLMISRFLFERGVVGATMTVYKEDGATASMTFTLNDATTPTAITRAT